MQAPRHEIILGIGGGVAAYKACDLLRRLQDEGFAVTPVPTPSSLNFVGAATWEALSGRKVTTSVFESVEEVRHVSLARNAHAIIIAPATADLIARIAAGRADDLLTNVILAAEVPVLIVPAMHPAMWFNSATIENVETLRRRGYDILEPEEGPLTSGDVGKGRFPTTALIIERFTESTMAPQDLQGSKVLVSAGGTREAIDPVRYIGNKSSGKQGIAIAEAAHARGADVTLVIANSTLPSHSGIKRVEVESALEMSQHLFTYFPETDYLFMAAAVADAAPVRSAEEKIKKADFTQIPLQENPDILATLSLSKRKQIIIGFAAETANDSHQLAREKMVRKGADLMYLNDVSGGAIFGSDTTSGIILNGATEVAVKTPTSKDHLAHTLINHAIQKRVQLGYDNV